LDVFKRSSGNRQRKFAESLSSESLTDFCQRAFGIARQAATQRAAGLVRKTNAHGAGFGDLDAGHLKDYAEALRTGETVIAVTEKLGDKRREIAELLKSHRAAK
jgi:hypothetical protein